MRLLVVAAVLLVVVLDALLLALNSISRASDLIVDDYSLSQRYVVEGLCIHALEATILQNLPATRVFLVGTGNNMGHVGFLENCLYQSLRGFRRVSFPPLIRPEGVSDFSDDLLVRLGFGCWWSASRADNLWKRSIGRVGAINLAVVVKLDHEAESVRSAEIRCNPSFRFRYIFKPSRKSTFY